MTFKHYNHGCTLFEHNNFQALAVGGGQSCDHGSSEIVEFLLCQLLKIWKKLVARI